MLCSLMCLRGTTFPHSKKKKYEMGCYTQNLKIVVPGWVLPLFSWTLGLQSILTQAYRCGSLGLWDCSPSLHKHTNVDQLHSRIAVHSTNMQTNTEPFQIIHAHQFCNQPLPKNVWITVHNTYLLATWLTTRANTYTLFPQTNTPYLRQTALTQHPLMHGAVLHRCSKRCIHIILKPSSRNGGILLGLLHSFKNCSRLDKVFLNF